MIVLTRTAALLAQVETLEGNVRTAVASPLVGLYVLNTAPCVVGVWAVRWVCKGGGGTH